jgi:hypothetical protein
MPGQLYGVTAALGAVGLWLHRDHLVLILSASLLCVYGLLLLVLRDLMESHRALEGPWCVIE